MNEIVEGIILKQIDYKDYDTILSVFTREYGKISLVARGVRRVNSKNASSLIPNTKTEFQFNYQDNKTIFSLKTARCKNLYRTMHEDIEIYTASTVISELLDAFTMQEMYEDTDYLMNVLEKSFSLLEAKANTQLVLFLAMIDIMNSFGIVPDVDECVNCGNTRVVTFSPKEGGFLCENCAKLLNVAHMDKEDLRNIRILVKSGLEHYEEIKDLVTVKHNYILLLYKMLEIHGGIRLNSIALFNRLFAID